MCQHLQMTLFSLILSFHLSLIPLNRFHFGDVNFCLKTFKIVKFKPMIECCLFENNYLTSNLQKSTTALLSQIENYLHYKKVLAMFRLLIWYVLETTKQISLKFSNNFVLVKQWKICPNLNLHFWD